MAADPTDERLRDALRRYWAVREELQALGIPAFDSPDDAAVWLAERQPSAARTDIHGDDGAVPLVDKAAIAQRLLAFGEEIWRARPEGPIVDDREADAFVKADPFALLVGVVCDYRIPAERAWVVPLELKRRLGHLDPGRIARGGERVSAAFALPPKLHRFVNQAAGYVVAAAERVVDEYAGDAARIWAGRPTARELFGRLASFKGIKQKKAAMAVEMLVQNFGVPVQEREGIDVAVDVHVRRVFLRTGLAASHDAKAIIRSARELHPSRPGALDEPAWWIGRKWCRPVRPECPSCPLSSVCPKLIGRASAVRGVG